MPNPAHGKVFTLPFSKISKSDIALAGGKGANLGEMYNAKVPVTNGFVVTANTYDKFLDEAGIRDQVNNLLKNLNVEDTDKLNSASKVACWCEVRITSFGARAPNRSIKASIIIYFPFFYRL